MMTIALMLNLLPYGFLTKVGGEIEAEAATFDDINQLDVFIKQASSNTCTLAANVMMLRRNAIIHGDSNWRDITETNCKGELWVNGRGMRWNYSYTHSGITANVVDYTTEDGFKDASGETKRNIIIERLKTHPEGIVVYDYQIPHAILITDYTDGQFYCADPANNRASGRINISQSNVKVENCEAYWWVTNPGALQTDTIPNDNTNPGSPYPVPTRTLTKGCTGDDVRWVQKFANDVLGEGIAIDGIYGNDTEWQVLYFQQQHGLSADGMAGPVTINAMLEEWRKQSNKDTTPPTISNVKISNINSTGYTVECDVSDNVGVTRVAFPTWTTHNDQDDIIWHEGSLSGNHASFRLNISEHGNEVGLYMTHIYAYDAAGNQTSANAGIINVKNGYGPMQTTVYNGHIYAVFDCECSWHDAKAKCEEMGGHLATITSEEENNFIAGILGNLHGYYIGATDEEQEGVFKWITGEEFAYCNWSETQPDNANNEEHYVEIYKSNGKWNDYPDRSINNRGFILEIDSEYSPVKTVEYGNSEYELYNISMPWDAAKLYCEQHGGTLACITSEAENNVIVDLINGAEKESYFLGATDKDNEGTWNWVSGESFSYSNWFEGEPSNRSGSGTIGPENFLSIYRGSGRWNDLRAQGDTTGFILERSVIRATGISLSKTTASITEGQTFNLVSTVHPSDARNQSVAWSSSDTGIATVDGNGTVTAKKAGTAVITATTSDGGYQASCTVTVTSAVLTGKLTVNNSTASLTKEAGSQITLNASATGGKGNYTYKFSVLNVNTGAWSVLKDFSNTSSFTYTMNYTGTKQFVVTVKDSSGKTAREKLLRPIQLM